MKPTKKTKIFSGILACSVYGIGSFLLIWGIAKGVQSLRYNNYLAGSDFKICKEKTQVFRGGMETVIQAASYTAITLKEANSPLFKNSVGLSSNPNAKFMDAYRIALNSQFENKRLNQEMKTEFVAMLKKTVLTHLGPCYTAAGSHYFERALQDEISKLDFVQLWDDFYFDYKNYKNP